MLTLRQMVTQELRAFGQLLHDEARALCCVLGFHKEDYTVYSGQPGSAKIYREGTRCRCDRFFKELDPWTR